MVWLGRHYIDLRAESDDVITKVEENTYLNFFTFTTITGQKTRYTLFAPMRQLWDDFQVQRGRSYKKGETIARGYIETGDQVFVDKVSYNFLPPTAVMSLFSKPPVFSALRKTSRPVRIPSTTSSDWPVFPATLCASTPPTFSSTAS